MAQGRASLIVVPREHGAWAMLVVPYIVGASIAGSLTARVVAGLAGVLLLFFSRASLALLLKSRSIDGSFGAGSLSRWLNLAIFAAAGSLVFLYLMVSGGIWQLGVVAVLGTALFFVHEWLVWHRRERSVAAELVGVALLTLTAPVAVFLSDCDSCERLAVNLWLLNALYFGASVFYVKMRLKTSARKRKPASLKARSIAAQGSVVYMATVILVLAVLSASDSIPPEAVAAFLPMICYQTWGIMSGARSMTLKAEGAAQTVLSAVFTLLLVGAYRL